MKKLISNSLFKELCSLVLVLIAVYLSSRAMFQEGFFRTIDDVTPVRIIELANELKRGFWLNNFPVRIGAEMAHHYGYLFFLFYAPLVYYVGALFMIIGHLSPIIATKAVFAIPLIIGPLLFYWSARFKLNRFSAVISTTLFSLFPYRGFDAYFRGGVGENWAISFIPGLFAGIFLLEKKSKYGLYLTSIFLALIIISHNISALMVLTLVLCYGLVFLRKYKQFWLSLLVGLGLSAFFFLPSLYYLPIIRANTLPLNTSNLLSSLLPFSSISKLDLSFIPGQATSPIFLYLLLGGIIYAFIKKISKLVKGKQLLFWLTFSLILYLMLSQPFSFLWQISLPISRMLQFPWRVLILLSFSIPIAIGYLLNRQFPKIISMLIGLSIVALSLTFLPSFKPLERSYFYAYQIEDTGPCATADFEDYFPYWVEECIDRIPEKDVLLTNDGTIQITNNRLIQIDGNYSSEIPNRLLVHRYYFPGWEIVVDNQPISLEYPYSISGLFIADIPAGSHNYSVRYRKTNIMWVADIISLLSLSYLGLGLLKHPLPKKYATKKS